MVLGEIQRPRTEKKLPDILSLEEVARVFDATENLHPVRYWTGVWWFHQLEMR